MRFTRAAVAFVAALGLAAATATPAAAIRYGEPDNGEHPYVGIMVAFVDDQPAWRCSGTLVSPTVYLTAGHCTFGADYVRVWFEENARDAGTQYPAGPGTSVLGTPYDHPDYDDAAFYLNDLGVVVLEKPVEMPQYASVAPLGYFDPLFVKRGPVKQQFTAVGYGLQRSLPSQTGLTESRPERMKATVRIINQDAMFGEKKAGNSVLFTNNAATGGTCSGDSGGPIFIAGTSVIAAVTSFGVNANCAGTGGGYRVDQPDDLDWLATFGVTPR